MKPWWTVCFVLCISLLGWGKGPSHSHSSQNKAEDPGYLPALAAADRFLNAWQAGDLETGTILISDHARHSQNLAELERFFSAGASRAYEIGHGKGRRGHYTFPVVLISESGGQAHRKLSEITLANTGKNDWAVDKLP